MDYIISSYFAIGAVLLLALASIWQRFKQRPKTFDSVTHAKVPVEKDPYADIEPMVNFDWKTTPPLRTRPFKDKYHLTMAIEGVTFSDIIPMDRTYLDRINLRRQLMTDHFDTTVQCNPIADAATIELYHYLIGTWLPRRYPTVFKLSPVSHSLLNTITSETIPLTPPSPCEALQTLSAHIDTDFLLLLPRPSPTTPDIPTYHLESYAVCFPSGFHLPSKLGLPLAAIHAPVPGYSAKLEKSMDRFFARLERGRVVKRANWTITTDPTLFRTGGTHMYEQLTDAHVDTTTTATTSPEVEDEQVVIENIRLRSERQVLFRLPVSGAIVFAFRTYADTLEDVVADGDGAALAVAIEGLWKGNVPEMARYKRGVVWGESVMGWLRDQGVRWEAGG